MKAKRVERTVSYRDDLDAIEAHIAIDSPRAALPSPIQTRWNVLT